MSQSGQAGWAGALLDMLFPRGCAGCGGAVGRYDGQLCWDCRSRLPVIAEPFCALCGNPAPGRIDQSYVCHYCAETPPHFDLARSAARFEGVVRDMILALKYGRAVWFVPDLADVLAAAFRTHYYDAAVEAVAYVPLFPARERERGYNQAQLLAAALAERTGLPLVRRGVRRIRSTPTQTSLTAPERASNVKGAFTSDLPARWRGRRWLLVDDVMTTGATVREVARTLKRGGLGSAYVLTLARGG